MASRAGQVHSGGAHCPVVMMRFNNARVWLVLLAFLVKQSLGLVLPSMNVSLLRSFKAMDSCRKSLHCNGKRFLLALI